LVASVRRLLASRHGVLAGSAATPGQ
jgi:hypothetical protein